MGIQIDKKTLDSLTELSRIECTEREKDALYADLQEILHYFEKLDEIDTTTTPPCNTVLGSLQSVLRDDVCCDCLPREKLLQNAPSQIGGLFRIPEVIKQD